MLRSIVRQKYLHLLCWAFTIFIFSCSTSSKQSKDKHFFPSPPASGSLVKVTSHYGKDSLLLLFLTYLPKAHFEVASVRSQVISTAPKRRSGIYYKYTIAVSDGQAIISGKYQASHSTANTSAFSEAAWIVIKFGGGGIINARGTEDAEIISDAINDAELSHDK